MSASTPHVSAGDPHTAQAGATLLGQGGNAVDAAVGATLAAFVAEPVLTAPLGGGFALLASPSQAPLAYDFFATVPGQGLPAARQTPQLDFQALEVSFGPTTQVFHGGRGAAAVGWLLPGLQQMQAQHGQLRWSQVVQPALQLASVGVPLSAQVASIARILTPILTLSAATRALFAPHGHVVQAGERLANPALARFLSSLGSATPAPFPAHLAAAALQDFGPPRGRLVAADMQYNGVLCQTPLAVSVGDTSVLLNPAPSLGGLLVGFGLQLLSRLVPAATWEDETTSYSALLACMAVTQQVRQQYVDAAACQGHAALKALLPVFWADDTLARWAPAFTAALQPVPLAQHTRSPDLGSTTHISAVDGQGMVCSITSSNGEGCGHMLPGVGAMANNFLGEADINPGGFHQLAAGARMTSMMCPTLICRAGKPQVALGTGGSNRIRTALLQVLVHHLLRHKPLAEAILMPRIHYEGGPLFVERQVLTQSLSPATLAALSQRVPQLIPFDAPNMFFGGVHAVATYQQGCGDPRRGGATAQPN